MRWSRCSLPTSFCARIAARSPRSVEVRGAEAVAKQARVFGRIAASAQPALVNGAVGFVVVRNGTPLAVAGFTVVDGRVAEIDVLADPARLREIDLTVLDD